MAKHYPHLNYLETFLTIVAVITYILIVLTHTEVPNRNYEYPHGGIISLSLICITCIISVIWISIFRIKSRRKE